MCPTSNIVIANRFGSLAEHPLPDLRGAGLLVTVNTDDPAMMELDLGQEYERVGEAYGYDIAELGRLATEGIESTWLDDADRRSLAAEFAEAIAAIPID